MALATLSGSEKQVDWATTIRTKRLPEIQKRLERLRQDFIDDGQGEAIEPVIAKANAWVLGQTDARWWIDNRDRHIEQILEQINTGISS